MTRFKIQGEYDPDDETYLYWSNQDGWVDFDSATTFDISELHRINMPMGTGGIAVLEETNCISLEEAYKRYPISMEDAMIRNSNPETCPHQAGTRYRGAIPCTGPKVCNSCGKIMED